MGCKKTKDGRFVPDETAEQENLFRWARFVSGKYPELDLMFHIPNEGKRTKSAGAQQRAMGLKRGMPDICLPVARGKYHSLYIELKAEGGRLSADQADQLMKLRRAGHAAEVCYGFEAAQETLLQYLSLGTFKWEET